MLNNLSIKLNLSSVSLLYRAWAHHVTAWKLQCRQIYFRSNGWMDLTKKKKQQEILRSLCIDFCEGSMYKMFIFPLIKLRFCHKYSHKRQVLLTYRGILLFFKLEPSSFFLCFLILSAGCITVEKNSGCMQNPLRHLLKNNFLHPALLW